MRKNRRVKIIVSVIVLLALAYVTFEFVQFNRAKTMLAEGMAAFESDKDCDALRSGVIGSRRINYQLNIF